MNDFLVTIRKNMLVRINMPIDGKLASVVVSCAVMVAVGYFVASADFENFKWNWYAALLAALFAIAFTGFICAAYGARWATLTKEETDKKIANLYHSIQRKARHLWWSLFLSCGVYIVYLVWQIFLEIGERLQ